MAVHDVGMTQHREDLCLATQREDQGKENPRQQGRTSNKGEKKAKGLKGKEPENAKPGRGKVS